MNAQAMLTVCLITLMLGSAKQEGITAKNEEEKKGEKGLPYRLSSNRHRTPSDGLSFCRYKEACCEKPPNCAKTEYIKAVWSFNVDTGDCSL
uniref:Putative secreted protein n=1 Tax=Amblyomma americanum TaxID=6943 RepID=A0A0C9R3R3_AMBAM